MSAHRIECQDCKWFTHARTKSGRIDRRHYGACNYSVVWPTKVPLKYAGHSVNAWAPPRPTQAIWATTNAEGCPCFEDRQSTRERQSGKVIKTLPSARTQHVTNIRGTDDGAVVECE